MWIIETMKLAIPITNLTQMISLAAINVAQEFPKNKILINTDTGNGMFKKRHCISLIDFHHDGNTLFLEYQEGWR
jgi:hypothetical protein